jgi:hypothetical protein
MRSATFAQSTEMMKVLMEHGAEARKGIYRQLKAMAAHMIAVERGYTEIVALTHRLRFPVGR